MTEQIRIPFPSGKGPGVRRRIREYSQADSSSSPVAAALAAATNWERTPRASPAKCAAGEGARSAPQWHSQPAPARQAACRQVLGGLSRRASAAKRRTRARLEFWRSLLPSLLKGEGPRVRSPDDDVLARDDELHRG